MIHILQGTGSALAAALASRLTEHPDTIVLPGLAGRSRSWNGLRGALAAAAGRLDPASYEAMLARHPIAARLLVPDHGHPEDAAADAECRRVQARLVSHLSHNWAINRPVFAAAADLLADLAATLRGGLAVRDLALLDWETAWTLRSLYRSRRADEPALFVGHDPAPPPAQLDEHGLVWGMFDVTVRETVLALRAREATVVEDLEEPVARERGDETEVGLGVAAVAGDPEPDAFARLASGAPLGAEEAEAVAETQLLSFRRFGFTSALALGLALLERPELELRGPVRGQVHGVVALSSHNRQFHTAGNHRLSDFIQRHLEAALELEPRPDRRAAILYRLAVTSGRRKGDLEACLAWCDRARTELASAELSTVRRAHLDAWIGNIRAYALMRRKALEAARAETSAGFEAMRRAREAALDEGAAAVVEGWSREMTATQSLLAHNQAVLSALAGDLESYVAWRGRGTALEAGEDGAARFEVGYWIDWYRYRRRPDLALPEAIDGLRSAEAELDVAKAYRYGIEAADLSYRLGRVEEADRRFREACALRRRLGDPAGLTPVELPSVPVRARAGRGEEAREILEAHLDVTEADDAKAALLSALGRLAAEAGAAEQADSWMDAAIEAAVSSGARDVLLRTAVAAGETSARLGRRREAARAYRQALELAAVDAQTHPPSPGELLAAHVGLAEQDEPLGDEHLRQAVSLVAPALREAEAWWLLPRLVRCLAASVRRRSAAAGPLDRSAVVALLEAARLRREAADGSLADDLALLEASFPVAATELLG